MTPNIEAPEELSKYKEAVENMAKRRDSYIFENRGEDHASIIISNIFEQADNKVIIFAEDLSGAISDKEGFKESVTLFLKKGKTLEVVLNKKPIESEFYKLLKDYKLKNPNQVNIRAVSEKFNNALKEADLRNCRFTVGDNSMFRIETNISSHEAIASFNNTKYSQILKSLFENNFNSCDEISDTN